MIAQTLVEYGAFHSIASAFAHAYDRLELLASGNLKYLLFVVLAALVVLIFKRRRMN